MKHKRAKTWRKWTEDEDALLKRLADADKTNAEIASVITDRTERAIVDRKHRLGIYKTYSLSPRNPRHVAALIKFKMAGWTLDRIAKVYNCCPTWVSKVLCQNGYKRFVSVQPKKKNFWARWSELELALLRKYLKKGYSVERIHAELPHRSLAAIRKKCTEVTRHWITPDEQSERAALKRKGLRVY